MAQQDIGFEDKIRKLAAKELVVRWQASGFPDDALTALLDNQSQWRAGYDMQQDVYWCTPESKDGTTWQGMALSWSIFEAMNEDA